MCSGGPAVLSCIAWRGWRGVPGSHDRRQRRPTVDDPAAESALPLRCFSGHRRRGPGASSSSAQHTPRAPGLQQPRSGEEAPGCEPADPCEAGWAWSPARARLLLQPFRPRGPREALLLGGAVTGRAEAEGPARWPPLGPRLGDPRPAAGKCFWFCVRLGPGTGIPLQGVGVSGVGIALLGWG